jgi:hypothetical protein
MRLAEKLDWKGLKIDLQAIELLFNKSIASGLFRTKYFMKRTLKYVPAFRIATYSA